MAKSVRFAKRKRSSFKKRRAQIGKKSKVARRRRHSRRRIYKGGASWITKDRSDLSHVWNSLFYERAKKLLNIKKNDEYFTEPTGKKVLFVIDMQKDFIDRKYKRATNEEKHPVNGQTHDDVGNFDVADGRTMLPYIHDDEGRNDLELIISDMAANKQTILEKIQQFAFLKHIYDALNNDNSNYKYVIFTRDYHPVGHSSFSPVFNNAPMLCRDCNSLTGNFPAHCVQGFEGSLFIPEIEILIRTAKYSDRIKILFKGMHMDSDSFTAVPKNVIDKKSSNLNHATCTSCSSVTGAYILQSNGYEAVLKKSVNYNETVSIDNKTEFRNFVKMDYTKLEENNDITHFEVCGLAGDYCVRDTVLALNQMFPNKQIVLLNDFTRYPALPFFTIRALPQHKSEIEIQVEGYQPLAELPAGIKPNVDYNKLTEANTAFFTSYILGNSDKVKADELASDAISPFLEYAKLQVKDKDIVYYLLKNDNGVRTLLTVDELSNVNEETITINALFNSAFQPKEYESANIHHFITPMSSIIEDYKKDKIVVVMSNYTENLTDGVV
jgi:nicotinamidase-related amidase